MPTVGFQDLLLRKGVLKKFEFDFLFILRRHLFDLTKGTHKAVVIHKARVQAREGDEEFSIYLPNLFIFFKKMIHPTNTIFTILLFFFSFLYMSVFIYIGNGCIVSLGGHFGVMFAASNVWGAALQVGSFTPAVSSQ